MAQFLLSCESTVEYMHSRGIPVIFYSYIVDEQVYPDDMGRDPEALPRFYAFLDAGKSMDETIGWVMAWRKRVHHPFYSTDLKYFRRTPSAARTTAASAGSAIPTV